MHIDELRSRLADLKQGGYVATMRRGNTGIGYTLESLLGVDENNISAPDLGEIELKAHRRGISSLITLFTFNRGAWQVPLREVIHTYGYTDSNGRRSLYNIVKTEPNTQGLRVRIEDEYARIYHVDGTLIAQWSGNALAETFAQKMPALATVYADTRINSDDREEFWFNEAYLYKNPTARRILELIGTNTIVIDLRGHINDRGNVRNHGTGFRIDDSFLGMCFDSREKLL